MFVSQPDLASLVFALSAGLLSFVSPCVVPLLPAYLGYMSGVSVERVVSNATSATRARLLTQSLAFVAGLSIVFTLLGASATLVGRILAQHIEVVTKLAGVLVIVFGLQMAGLIRLPFLQRELRPGLSQPASSGALRGLVIGGAFAAGWTPCVGPFLATVLTLASQEQSVGSGMLLLFAYSLGLGLPFVAGGLAIGRALHVARALSPRLQSIEVASGALLVGMGALLLTDQLARLSSSLTRIFGIGLAV